MNKFSLTVFGSLAVGAVAALPLIYLLAGVQWKKRPWIPLSIGTVLLLLCFLFDWWLEIGFNRSVQLVGEYGGRLSPQAREIISSMAVGYRQQAKFLELAVIPISVSLMVTGFTLRVDNEYARGLREIDEGLRRIVLIEMQIQEAESAMSAKLSQNLRGVGLLDASRRVSLLKSDRRYRSRRLREARRELGFATWDDE